MKYQIKVGDYNGGEYSVSAALVAAGIDIDDITLFGWWPIRPDNQCDYIKVAVRYSFGWKDRGTIRTGHSFGCYLIGDCCRLANDENFEKYCNKNYEILGREIFDIDETVADQIVRDVIIARSQLEDLSDPSEYLYYCKLDDLPEEIEVVE